MICHAEDACAQETATVRRLNDCLRQTGTDGKVMLTRAVAALAQDQLTALLQAVREFGAFTRDNDPWGEHDFGRVAIGADSYFWKIDAYDLNLEFASPDPADEAVTCRVMTIMTAQDL